MGEVELTQEELDDLEPAEIEEVEEVDVSDEETDDAPTDEPTEDEAEEDEPDEPETPDEAAVAPEFPSEADVLRYQVEQLTRSLTSSRKSHDKLTGRFGPEVDQLRRENARLRGRLTQSPSSEDYDEGTRLEPARASRDPEIEQLRAELMELKASRGVEDASAALRDEANAFRQRFPAVETMSEELQPYLESNQDKLRAVLESGDPEEVRSTFRLMMGEAVMAVVQERGKTAAKRSKKQRAELKGKKRLAAPVGTGARSAPIEPKDPRDMTDKELRAVLKEAGHKGF